MQLHDFGGYGIKIYCNYKKKKIQQVIIVKYAYIAILALRVYIKINNYKLKY